MNPIEQAYADYLFPLTPQEAAQSWDRIITHVPTQPQEVDYHNYLDTLNEPSKEVSIYLVFCDLYDRINISIHPLYEVEFENVGYSLAPPCKKRKEPAK